MVGVDRTPVLESTVVPAALRAIRTSSFSVVNKRRLNELALTALALIHLSTANIVLPQIVGCCAIAQQGLNPAVICSRAKMYTLICRSRDTWLFINCIPSIACLYVTEALGHQTIDHL